MATREASEYPAGTPPDTNDKAACRLAQASTGAAVRGASFGLVISAVSVSPLDWATRRVAQVGRVLARRLGCDVRFPDRAGHGIRLLEEDLAMSDRIPAAGDADDQRGSEPDMSATDEFARMRAVMRASEKHREGGVDPELEVADVDPGSDT